MQSFKNLNLEMKYCFSQKKTIKLMNESGGYGGVGVDRKFFEKKNKWRGRIYSTPKNNQFSLMQ